MSNVVSTQPIGIFVSMYDKSHSSGFQLVQITTDEVVVTVIGPVGMISVKNPLIMEVCDDGNRWVNTGYGRYRIIT